MGILFWKDALHQGQQSLKTFPHIGRFGVSENALWLFKPSHASALPAQCDAAGKNELEGGLRRGNRLNRRRPLCNARDLDE